ncbi:MAG TPA: hypothetical protein VE685_00885 [Thermoanaerobaculia bacterium]|nr:hypothetical protein [Thermoanaerobaculia bacterium]
MAKILSYPEVSGDGPPRRAIKVRVVVRRLRKLTETLREVSAEITYWQSRIPPPSPEELKGILEDRRPITSAQHLLGILYGMRLLLEEVCEVAEEPASFPREGNTYFGVHPKVLRGLRTLVYRRHRPERLRASTREDAADRDRL